MEPDKRLGVAAIWPQAASASLSIFAVCCGVNGHEALSGIACTIAKGCQQAVAPTRHDLRGLVNSMRLVSRMLGIRRSQDGESFVYDRLLCDCRRVAW
jgi:hypothetical protein